MLASSTSFQRLRHWMLSICVRRIDLAILVQKEKEELAHAQQSYDDAEPWHLPIGHRPQDSLATEGLAMASTDAAIPEHNKGFQMLQRMGWKGTGLGRNENGMPFLLS